MISPFQANEPLPALLPRRGFLKAATQSAAGLVAAGAGFHGLLRAQGKPGASGMSIRHGGALILDSPLPGETRAELVAPAHPNGWQLAMNRFLVLYATRGCIRRGWNSASRPGRRGVLPDASSPDSPCEHSC